MREGGSERDKLRRERKERRAGRPLNSEGPRGIIFWGRRRLVVVRRPFHGTTERKVTLFSILSLSLSLSPCVCWSLSLRFGRSGWGQGIAVSRSFIPARCGSDAQKPINRRNLWVVRDGRGGGLHHQNGSLVYTDLTKKSNNRLRDPAL